jgi:recombinational DNA repair protein (RecF pathway)
VYTIYTTHAFLLREFSRGEADKELCFLTDRFGVIYVVASGIRKLASKNRMHLVSGVKLSLSLVKGKNTWRLTGIERVAPESGLRVPYSLATLAITKLIVREEKLREIFDEFSAASALCSPESSSFVDRALTLRVLSLLGFMEQYQSHSLKDLLAETPEVKVRYTEHLTRRLQELAIVY